MLLSLGSSESAKYHTTSDQYHGTQISLKSIFVNGLCECCVFCGVWLLGIVMYVQVSRFTAQFSKILNGLLKKLFNTKNKRYRRKLHIV